MRMSDSDKMFSTKTVKHSKQYSQIHKIKYAKL